MLQEQDEYYGIYGPLLEQTMQGVMTKLKRILDGIAEDPEQAPFEHLISRVKGVDSARNKLIQRGFSEDAVSAIKNLTDILGIRVITHFIGDIYEILDRISESKAWRVEQVKDYIASPKPNGYRSLHVILQVPFELQEENGIREIGVEIQLRTIAMDCWAALEHQMRYKKHVKNTTLIFEELKRCADEMASADLTMQTIRDVLKEE